MKTTRREFLAASVTGLVAAPATLVFPVRAGMAQTTAEAAMKYEPTWESIKQHRVPKWFDDAKLGIFVHWGLYSVPAWAPTLKGPKGEINWAQFMADPKRWFRDNPYAEWYLNSMKIKDSPTWEHHVSTWGADFKYEDFIPIFLKESRKWKPGEWAALFEGIGARYVVFTTKHADGYPLWPTAAKNPHLKVDHLAAERDYVGELTKAVRARGMKMGTYYCGGMDWSFVPDAVQTIADIARTVPQSEEYARYADAQWRELIDRYQPSVLWDDISYPKKGDVLHLFADYYNRVPDGVINDRFQVEHSDFTTPEYRQYNKIVEKKWETCRGLGFSFGYNQNEGPDQLLSADELVRLFVDIVSKNGNLLLNVGPKADGTIPQIQVDRLRALGQWLRMNGEAIYGTQPWVIAEGKSSDGLDIRFTRKGDSIYSILLGTPKSSVVTIESLSAAENSTVQLLGLSGNLKWSQKDDGLAVTLPEKLPGSYAHALRISPEPRRLVRES